MKQRLRNILLTTSILVGSLLVFSASSCKEDPNTLPEKLMTYMALCPSGIDVCYSECDPTGDPLTDSDMQSYTACASYCDMKCDQSFLYLMFQ